MQIGINLFNESKKKSKQILDEMSQLLQHMMFLTQLEMEKVRKVNNLKVYHWSSVFDKKASITYLFL